MDYEKTCSKIRDLLSSGQQVNTKLALQLISSQLNSSLEKILHEYPLVFKKKDNSKGFYLHIRLGHLVIEYDYLNSFVPYMGYQKKAKRNIKVHLKKEGEYPVDLQESWDVREIENPLEIQRIFIADYFTLIPQITPLMIKILD